MSPQSDGSGGTTVVQELLAGSVAGAAGTFAGYPFDTVKVRLQSQLHGYRGPLSCLMHMLRYEGVGSLYRGLTPPLLGGAAETGINYAVYRQLRAALRDADGAAAPYHTPAAAAVAGGAMGVVCGPIELIKCRMQAGHMVYAGPVDCTRHLIKSEGWRGLSRGMGATLLREVPGNAVLFSMYELIRSVLLPERATSATAGQMTMWEMVQDTSSTILAGGLAGCAFWMAVLPVDVAKTRIQLADAGSKLDVGVTAQLRMLYAKGGPAKLWTGLTPTLVRAFPENACQWLAWEACMHYLR